MSSLRDVVGREVLMCKAAERRRLSWQSVEAEERARKRKWNCQKQTLR